MARSRVLGISGFETCPGTFAKSPSGGPLRGEHVQLGETRLEQRRDHRGLAHAVQRRVDDGDVPGVADRLGDDGRRVGVVDLQADEDDRAVFQGRLVILLGELAVRGILDAFDDARVVGRDDLAAGRGVALEAVVRRGVVRGGDHDPAIAFQISNGEGEQGGRAVFGKEEDLESGRRQDPGARPGELGGVVPGVPGDGARSRGIAPLGPGDVVGQPPSALGDGPGVEDVRPDRVHLTPTASRAELQNGVERVVEHLPTAGLDVFDEAIAVGGERRLGEPAFDIDRGRVGEFAGRFGPFHRAEDVVGGCHLVVLRRPSRRSSRVALATLKSAASRTVPQAIPRAPRLARPLTLVLPLAAGSTARTGPIAATSPTASVSLNVNLSETSGGSARPFGL